MKPQASDDDLLARQHALQAEATELLAGLDLPGFVSGIGPLELTGSYVSGLMCMREVDVMVLVGGEFAPEDVMRLLTTIIEYRGVTDLRYCDQRGPRSATGLVRDERYHVPFMANLAGQSWIVDLSLWLNDLHLHTTRWHRDVGRRISSEQRGAILRIKDTWSRRPVYRKQVDGLDIYNAVLEGGVRTSAEFGAWLASPTVVRQFRM